MFQQKLPEKVDSTKSTFPVPIYGSKIQKFHPYAPGIKYINDYEKNFCFSSLSSDLLASK